MGSPILIREATRDDWQAIERVARAAWHADYSTTAEVVLELERLDDKVAYMRDEFNAFGSRFVVATDGGRVVGALIAHAVEGRVWVDDLFVEPGARRQGIARELVKAVSPKDAEVCAEVNARNAPALALFRELGYEKAVETVVWKRPPQG
jgi:GNAT superfamily N-acetyltransferase